MAVTVRFHTVRLDKKLSAALHKAAGDDLIREYNEAAEEINRSVSDVLSRSGRGGSQRDEFVKQEKQVTRALSGRYNIRVGWLNPSRDAAERGGGGRLWYQYQDSGFHMFGGPRWLDGVGATLDRRERLVSAIEEINRRHVGDIARELNR